MAKSCNFPTFPRPLPLLYLHVQVLEWAQRILAAGEAFSGVECSSLRSMLTAQSSNFFNAYHSSNLEALHSMLEKELWRRLPSFGEGITITMMMIKTMTIMTTITMILILITTVIVINDNKVLEKVLPSFGKVSVEVINYETRVSSQSLLPRIWYAVCSVSNATHPTNGVCRAFWPHSKVNTVIF